MIVNSLEILEKCGYTSIVFYLRNQIRSGMEEKQALQIATHYLVNLYGNNNNV